MAMLLGISDDCMRWIRADGSLIPRPDLFRYTILAPKLFIRPIIPYRFWDFRKYTLFPRIRVGILTVAQGLSILRSQDHSQEFGQILERNSGQALFGIHPYPLVSPPYHFMDSNLGFQTLLNLLALRLAQFFVAG